MADDQVTYYIADSGPTIVRRLSSQGKGEFDVTDQDFRLRARPQWSDTVVLDEAMVKNTSTDELSYDPKDGDFPEPGIYKAWIKVTYTDGRSVTTEEFDIFVLEHAPGSGVRVGAISRAARALSPIAWDSLRGYSDYGDPELQRVIELAKLRTLPSTVDAVNEAGLDPRVVDYVAKLALVKNILPAVIDYWTSIMVSQSARANSDEVKTYPDRIRAVEGQIDRFAADIAEQASEIGAIVGVSPGVSMPGPVVVGGGPRITPDISCAPSPLSRRRTTPVGLDSE